MITLNFSRNSWHYRFIASMKDERYISNNICGYFWDFVFCCLAAALVFAVVVIVLYVMGVAPLMWLWVSIKFGYLDPHAEAIVGVFFDILAIHIAGFFYISDVWLPAYYEAKRLKDYAAMQRGEYKPKSDSFVKAAWKKFKNKTCARIEFGE